MFISEQNATFYSDVRTYLDAIGLRELKSFEIPDDEYAKELAHASRQHLEETRAQHQARAIARVAFRKYGKKAVPPQLVKVVITERDHKLIMGWAITVLVMLLLILLSGLHAHAQVDGIQVLDNSNTVVKGWFGGVAKLKCSTNLTCTLVSGVVTITASGGGGGTPGGSPKQVQFNDTGAFNGIGDGTAGQVLISNGAGNAASFQDPIVSGPAAEGASPANNPVWVAGKGADNLIHSIRMANDGTVRVDPSGTTTQPVSLATLPALVAGSAVIGHVIVDTAPTTAVTGTFFQATQPVSSTQLPAALDGSGFLKVHEQGTATVSGTVTTTPPANASTNWTQLNSVALGSPSNYGTSPGAVSVQGVNAFITNIPHAIIDTGSTTAVTGNVTVIQGTGTNLHAVLDTTSTTAVTQATGTNLHAVLDTTSTTAVTQATGTNLHAVLDTTSTTAVTQATASNLNANVSQATGTNLHAVLDTTSTTAVTQATGTNLHAVLDTTSTTAVTQATGTNLHAVLDSGSTTAVTGATTAADAAANPTTTIPANDFPETFNGSTWDRQRSAGIGNNVASTGILAEASYGQFNVTAPSLADTKYSATQMDANGRTLIAAPNVEYALNRLIALASLPGPMNTGRVRASFGRPVTSTGDALDVNIKYPPAVADPCSGPTKTNVPISLTANTRLVVGTSTPIRICSIFLLSTSAETFSVVEGTGAVCATGIAAVIGSTTAANGPSAAANGGYSQGNGAAWVASAKTAGNDVCILISGSTLIAGNLTYAF